MNELLVCIQYVFPDAYLEMCDNELEVRMNLDGELFTLRVHKGWRFGLPEAVAHSIMYKLVDAIYDERKTSREANRSP